VKPFAEVSVVNQDFVLQRTKLVYDAVQVLVQELLAIGHLEDVVHFVASDVTVVISVNLLNN
jgi:hypothetical protein